MKQELYLSNCAIDYLSDILKKTAPINIFLVHGKKSYCLSGAEAKLKDILKPYRTYNYFDFKVNPEKEDVERGLKLFKQQDHDILIAIGGGSVLDIGKLIRIMAVQDASLSKIVAQHKSINRRGIPMIAIPTTAGSGSEATHFAVVYINKIKFSVAHKYMLPDIAIVDPVLTHSMPPKLTAVTGIDVLSQAVESYWSINSTAESKIYSKQAIELVMQNLERCVHKPSQETRYAMCEAAYLAGQAINISKTTAPHAVSYTLTSHLGIPHGHAVGLTLGEFIVYNSQVNEKDVADYRGATYVHETIDEICAIFGEIDTLAVRARIRNLMQSIDLRIHLEELGVVDVGDYAMIINQVNLERLGNNPRRVTKEDLLSILMSIV